MIPAKPPVPVAGLEIESIGYLMSEYLNNMRNMYTCVDMGIESVPGSLNHNYID